MQRRQFGTDQTIVHRPVVYTAQVMSNQPWLEDKTLAGNETTKAK